MKINQDDVAWLRRMSFYALVIAAFAIAVRVLVGPAFAEGPHPACQGDPRCGVLPDDHPALRGYNATYHESGYIYMSEEALRDKPDCARIIYEHELEHRRQHERGEDFTSQDAERRAHDKVPAHNCAYKRPRGTLSR